MKNSKNEESATLFKKCIHSKKVKTFFFLPTPLFAWENSMSIYGDLLLVLKQENSMCIYSMSIYEDLRGSKRALQKSLDLHELASLPFQLP